jgi:uncharacterized membrane protein
MVVSSLPMFFGAMLTDVAYARTYEIQWNNFSSWLIVGGLVFAGVALLFAGFDLARARRRTYGTGLYAAIVLAAWVVGFLNALMHARDAFASMPTGLILSIITAALACIAVWLGFRGSRVGAQP